MTLKASPLGNRGYERSEHPRTAMTPPHTLKGCPRQLPVMKPIVTRNESGGLVTANPSLATKPY